MKRNLRKVLAVGWLLLLVIAITLGDLAAYSRNASPLDATPLPYRVTITTSNFRISQLAASADDLSNPEHILFHLQNGTTLWYGMSVTSKPSGIIPIAATPIDSVSSTFLSSVPLLPPAQVLPLDQWNGVYSFETLQLNVSFSGPGQQLQLTLSPTEPHAVTLDALTLLLHLLGQHSTGTQIGLLENGLLPTIFTMTGNMKDFEALVQDYGQLFTSELDSTQMLAQAYACALDISNLLSDNSEQATLADLLWRVQGKAIPRESILHSITSFSETQFGLAVEGFIKSQAASFAPMFSNGDTPTVLLQTISNTTPSPTASASSTPTVSATSSVKITPRIRPTARPTVTQK